jgi:hypothetical protein
MAERKLKDKQFEKTVVGQLKKKSSDEDEDDEESDYLGVMGDEEE